MSEGQHDDEILPGQARMLRAEARSFKTILDSVGDAVISVDTDGNVLMMNPAAEALTGQSEAEARGRPLAAAFMIGDQKSRSAAESPVMCALREGAAVELPDQTWLIARDGRQRPIAGCAVPIRDDRGDISAVALAVRADTRESPLPSEESDAPPPAAVGRLPVSEHLSVKTAGQFLASIIEYLPDATFVIDREKRVVAWNRACETMTGVGKESLLGKGDHAYAEPFFGYRRPLLIDLLDEPSPEAEAFYEHIERKEDVLYAESFIPRMRRGQGAHLWGEAVPLYDRHGRRCGAIEVIRDVTEQKAVERALRESELKHRLLFETASDAIFLMRSDRFIACNERTLTMFGCTREQIIGQPPHRFSPPVQPDGRPSEEKALEKIGLALSEGPQRFEWEHCRQDRTPFAAEVSLNRMELGGEVLLQAIVRDITDRKRMEEALRASEREYRDLVMLANSIILRWSSDGRITFLNEFGQRFFGYTSDEIVGRHVVGTIVPESESTGRDLTSLMEEICADPGSFERNCNENMRRGGERVWVDWTNKVVLDERNQLKEILSIGSDITEQKRAEAELEKYRDHLEEQVRGRTRELAAAKDRAESADRLKSAFLATMSHELRTPLNSIIGFTGILLQQIPGPLNEEQQKQLGMVRGSARHLLALISDVLDISKIEAGQVKVEQEAFDVGATVRTVVDSIDESAKDMGLSLNLEMEPQLGEVIGDRRRYEQVLLNLLSNALKFTEIGSVAVKVRRAEAGTLEATVRDTGIGISQADLKGLFQPFHQVENGTSRKYEGTGLGLSICRRLVELMGGTIWVQSEPGAGSTFGFSVPVQGLGEGEP